MTEAFNKMKITVWLKKMFALVLQMRSIYFLMFTDESRTFMKLKFIES